MRNQCDLERYRTAIRLDELFDREAIHPLPEGAQSRALDSLLGFLASERGERPLSPEAPYGEKRRALQALLTVRPPDDIPKELHILLDRLLVAEGMEREVVDLADIRDGKDPGAVLLWQGDITRLRVDAIVNAANNQLLGCFHPFHGCIDNVIHDIAGPRLRRDCHTIMALQGAAEATGSAKITRGYHLPARFVLHTVGPIFRQEVVTQRSAVQLAGCYTSCLDLAARVAGVRSVAFCCISTGVFGFPKECAAQVAITTVRRWLDRNPGTMDAIVFNVYEDRDHSLYEKYLAQEFDL